MTTCIPYMSGDTMSPTERVRHDVVSRSAFHLIILSKGVRGKGVRVCAIGASRTPSPDVGIVKGVTQHP